VAKGPRLPEFEIAGRSGQFSLNESRLTPVWQCLVRSTRRIITGLDSGRLATRRIRVPLLEASKLLPKRNRSNLLNREPGKCLERPGAPCRRQFPRVGSCPNGNSGQIWRPTNPHQRNRPARPTPHRHSLLRELVESSGRSSSSVSSRRVVAGGFASFSAPRPSFCRGLGPAEKKRIFISPPRAHLSAASAKPRNSRPGRDSKQLAAQGLSRAPAWRAAADQDAVQSLCVSTTVVATVTVEAEAKLSVGLTSDDKEPGRSRRMPLLPTAGCAAAVSLHRCMRSVHQPEDGRCNTWFTGAGRGGAINGLAGRHLALLAIVLSLHSGTMRIAH
jgi:hypothetical protein